MILLNFAKWGHAARDGRLRRIYDRIYYKGYIWTPFVKLKFKWLEMKGEDRR